MPTTSQVTRVSRAHATPNTTNTVYLMRPNQRKSKKDAETYNHKPFRKQKKKIIYPQKLTIVGIKQELNQNKPLNNTTPHTSACSLPSYSHYISISPWKLTLIITNPISMCARPSHHPE